MREYQKLKAYLPKLNAQWSALLLAVIAFSGCQGSVTSFDNLGGNSQNSSPINPTPTPETTPPVNPENPGDPTDLLTADFISNVYEGKAAIGVKNYEQIYNTMLAVTGVSDIQPPLDPTFQLRNTLRNRYLVWKSSLPSSNSINSLSPSQMLGILNLANDFCTSIIFGVGAFQPTFLAGSEIIDNAGRLIPMTTPDQKLKYVRFFTNKFWGSGTDTSSERANSETELVGLLTDMTTRTGQDPNPQIGSIMTGLCAAVLASPAVIFF